MQLPRRTANLRWDELKELFTSLYPEGAYAIAIDENYYHQRREGIERCKVWLNRGNCPYAVESTMNLIESQQLDERLSSNSGSKGINEWPIRSIYAMAILRFVNSLADSMQNGLYAQSIFTIAERIGLPLWFVELRHASTHEELPTLNVLRQASVDALGWLLKQFWLPNIQQRSILIVEGSDSMQEGSNFTDHEQTKMVQEIALELRKQINSYRTLAKQIASDASLQGPLKASINSTQSRIASCVKKADEQLSRHYNGKKNSTSTVSDRISGMDILVDVLCSPGGLIPLAVRKRIRLDENGKISPLPSLLVEIWSSLLAYLSQEFETFNQALIDMLIDCVINQEEGGINEQSVVDTAASWLLYLIDGIKVGSGSNGQEKGRGGHFKVKRGLTSSEDELADHPLSTISIVRKCLAQPTKASIALSKMLCENNERLNQRIGHLLEFAELAAKIGTEEMQNSQKSQDTPQQDKKDDEQMTDLERSILAMEKQLDELKEKKEVKTQRIQEESLLQESPATDITISAYQQKQMEVCNLLDGWDTMDQNVWRPTPIGCLNVEQAPLQTSDLILSIEE